jgi:hypothetical protein
MQSMKTYQQPVVLREVALLRALGTGLRTSRFQRLVGRTQRFMVPPQSTPPLGRAPAIQEAMTARRTDKRLSKLK